VMFKTMTRIWEETKEGREVYELSKSNLMRHELEGSIFLNVNSRDFLCEG
jgi:hypothetical protein